MEDLNWPNEQSTSIRYLWHTLTRENEMFQRSVSKYIPVGVEVLARGFGPPSSVMDLLFLPIFDERLGVEVISAELADGAACDIFDDKLGVEVISAELADGAAGDKWYSDVS